MRWKRSHAASHRRQGMVMIERAQVVQELHPARERFRFRRLDPGKRFEVLNAARLERQQRPAEFQPPDFGQRLRRALLLLALGPKPDAVAGRGAARAAEPLLGRGAADLFDEERVDPAMGIEPGHARQAAVDDDAHRRRWSARFRRRWSRRSPYASRSATRRRPARRAAVRHGGRERRIRARKGCRAARSACAGFRRRRA